MTSEEAVAEARPVVRFTVDGAPVEVEADGCSLLEALRDRLGVRGPKDGCSPQGQCGCCTVWVDGQPRVACVTPVARVAGRTVTTIDGLPEADAWAEQLCAGGGSQCGFCTPGIVMRLAALEPAQRQDGGAVRQALLAHLCRCTGWAPIIDAAATVDGAPEGLAVGQGSSRDLLAAARRAELEGGSPQQVSPAVALGRGGFAADRAPLDALVAVRGTDGRWVVGETLQEARRAAGKVQGRRTTEPLQWPIEVPAGDWARTLQTTWVEPAYLEPDAAWCVPGGQPVLALTNGGAFGGKAASEVGEGAPAGRRTWAHRAGAVLARGRGPPRAEAPTVGRGGPGRRHRRGAGGAHTRGRRGDRRRGPRPGGRGGGRGGPAHIRFVACSRLGRGRGPAGPGRRLDHGPEGARPRRWWPRTRFG